MQNRNNSIDIYLDLNIYISIAKREKNYEYLIAKINNLSKSSVTFPHSPAHGEELFALSESGRDEITYSRVFALIEKYNNNYGYAPGKLSLQVATEMYRNYRQLSAREPGLATLTDIFLSIINEHNLGLIREVDYETQRINQSLLECIKKVAKYSAANSFANTTETFHLGRRNENSLKDNFSKINVPTEGVVPFTEIHKKYKIGPRLISEISPNDIFLHKGIEEFAEITFKENDLDYNNIPVPDILNKNHHLKEEFITVTMNLLEKSGFHQEKKNHEASLIGRMHDVTHSIYASQADYFVSNDERLSKKTIATFHKLGIKTKVLNVEDFLYLNLNN